MGHRHTSEKFGAARGVLEPRGGSAAPVAGRDEAAILRPALAELFNISHPSAHQIIVPMESPATPENLRQHTPAVRAALMALRFYKAYLSMLMAGSCRFTPTCSQFTYQAIERFGVLRGSWLGCKRLLRCQPLSRRFGFDPVPDEWPGKHSHTNFPDAHSAITSSASDTSSSASLSGHNEAHS
jgi:uncharacterized protein